MQKEPGNAFSVAALIYGLGHAGRKKEAEKHLGWFKTDAREHISRIWEMVEILERNGIYVKKIRTDKPGYVIYEDDWQLVAEPLRKGTVPRR